MAQQSTRQTPPPIVQGFFICREVFKDIRTNEFILLGPTTHFRLQHFPCKLAFMGFLQLVGAHAPSRFSASLVNTEEVKVWSWSCDKVVVHPDPLFSHQIVFHEWFPLIPEAGRYRLDLFDNGTELVSQSLFMGPAERFLEQR